MGLSLPQPDSLLNPPNTGLTVCDPQMEEMRRPYDAEDLSSDTIPILDPKSDMWR